MILIFGGAYQGKLDFAKEKFNISDSDVFSCREDAEPDFSKKVIANAELFILKCLKDGREAKEVFADNKALFADKIIILTDMSQGIVPTDKTLRAWREMTGRTTVYLAKEADEVYRVFCGLSDQLK